MTMPLLTPFTVALTVEDPETRRLVQRWLQLSGELGDEATAVRFTFRPHLTMADKIKRDRLRHDYAGGLRLYIDLVKGLDAAHRAIVSVLEAQLWPGGRPRAGTPEEEAEQRRALEAAWAADGSDEKVGWVEMRSILDRVDFLAAWEVQIVNPPAGWERIADRELPDPVFYAIWETFTRALETATLGKPKPSAP